MLIARRENCRASTSCLTSHLPPCKSLTLQQLLQRTVYNHWQRIKYESNFIKIKQTEEPAETKVKTVWKQWRSLETCRVCNENETVDSQLTKEINMDKERSIPQTVGVSGLGHEIIIRAAHCKVYCILTVCSKTALSPLASGNSSGLWAVLLFSPVLLRVPPSVLRRCPFSEQFPEQKLIENRKYFKSHTSPTCRARCRLYVTRRK